MINALWLFLFIPLATFFGFMACALLRMNDDDYRLITAEEYKQIVEEAHI